MKLSLTSSARLLPVALAAHLRDPASSALRVRWPPLVVAGRRQAFWSRPVDGRPDPRL